MQMSNNQASYKLSSFPNNSFIKHLLSTELGLLGAMHRNERKRNSSVSQPSRSLQSTKAETTFLLSKCYNREISVMGTKGRQKPFSHLVEKYNTEKNL